MAVAGLAEFLATWRDTWKRLEYNPLLLLIVVLAAAALTEGGARLTRLLQGYFLGLEDGSSFGYLQSILIFQGVTLGATLAVDLIATAGALLVVLHEQSFFREMGPLAPGRFWLRAIFAWSAVLLVPLLVSSPIGVLNSIIATFPSSSPMWVVWYLGWGACYSALQAFLASLLLWRLPAHGVRETEAIAGHRGRPRLFGCYIVLFEAAVLFEIAIWYLGGNDFHPLARLRINIAEECVVSFLAVLIAFVSVQRSASVAAPSIAAVFE